MHLHGKLGPPANGVRHGMCSTKRELSILPLPLGEAGRRPGEGAFRSGTLDESTLTPALSQRERENENRQQRCKIRVAELVPNRFGLLPDFPWGSSMQSQRFARCCWCSFGGILPPGGSQSLRRGAASDVLPVRSLPLPASGRSDTFDEARGSANARGALGVSSPPRRDFCRPRAGAMRLNSGERQASGRGYSRAVASLTGHHFPAADG